LFFQHPKLNNHLLAFIDLHSFLYLCSFVNKYFLGAVRDCGDDEYPGIYVRLDHPSIWFFIASVIWPTYGMAKQMYELAS
jgi:hypothetical protein